MSNPRSFWAGERLFSLGCSGSLPQVKRGRLLEFWGFWGRCAATMSRPSWAAEGISGRRARGRGPRRPGGWSESAGHVTKRAGVAVRHVWGTLGSVGARRRKLRLWRSRRCHVSGIDTRSRGGSFYKLSTKGGSADYSAALSHGRLRTRQKVPQFQGLTCKRTPIICTCYIAVGNECGLSDYLGSLSFFLGCTRFSCT